MAPSRLDSKVEEHQVWHESISQQEECEGLYRSGERSAANDAARHSLFQPRSMHQISPQIVCMERKVPTDAGRRIRIPMSSMMMAITTSSSISVNAWVREDGQSFLIEILKLASSMRICRHYHPLNFCVQHTRKAKLGKINPLGWRGSLRTKCQLRSPPSNCAGSSPQYRPSCG